MAIKHTHPEYENPKQREEALESTKQACLNAVSALRGAAHKRSV